MNTRVASLQVADASLEIRLRLMRHFGVSDCAVLCDGVTRVFVTAATELPVAAMAGRIEDLCPQGAEVEQLTSLPLDGSGAVDVEQLRSLPRLSPQSLGALESRMKAAHPSIHLSLVPNRSVRGAEYLPATARLSEVHGPELSLPTGSFPQVLSQALEKAARHQAQTPIEFIQGDGTRHVLTYQDLHAHALRFAAGIRASGAAAGTPVIMQSERPSDAVLLFWATVLAGLVPVAVARPRLYDDNDPVAARLLSVIGQLPGCRVVCIGESVAPLQNWLQLHGYSRELVIAANAVDPDASPETAAPASPDQVALYLLTSGSTSAPKLVPQTHRRLLARCAATIQKNGFTPDDVSLNWMSLDHVGGLVMFHLRDVVVGCKQIQVATSWILMQPSRWMQLCHEHGVTATWAPNFAFNLLCEQQADIAAAVWDLARLRFIMNAGESVIGSHVATFLRVLERHGLSCRAVFPAWGMSETCSAVLFNDRFTPRGNAFGGRFVSVGRPIAGVAARVVDERNRVVLEGRRGRLQVKGACVFDGYAYNDVANRNDFTTDGWFDTGDLAICENGQIAIVGRAKDVIILNGQNIAAHEIEERIGRLDGVAPSSVVVVAVRNADDSSDGVVIFLHPTVPAAERVGLSKRVRAAVVRGFGLQPRAIVFVEPHEIPRTSIGKVQKEPLKLRYLNSMLNEKRELLDLDSAEAPVWRNVYRRAWLRRALPEAALEQGNPVLLVASRADLNDMAHSLSAALGAATQLLSVALEDETAIQTALHTLRATRAAVGAVIFVAPSHDQRSEPRLASSSSAYRFTRAMLSVGLRPERFFMVDRYTQSVTGEEPELNIAGACGIGLLRAIAAESPDIRCRHVDCESRSAVGLVEFIMHELNEFSGETEVAYRAGQRFVARLVQEADSGNLLQDPFEPGIRCVVVGGLGGLAQGLVRQLLTSYHARVVLMGRTQAEALDSTKKARLRALEAAAPGRVFYMGVASTDAPALSGALDAAVERLGGPLQAVLDLAGTFTQKPIKSFADEEYERELATKTLGTWNIYSEAVRRGIPRVIIYSSVNGYFGGAGVPAYSAANRFPEALVDFARHRESGPAVVNLAWSMWDDIGISHGLAFRELTERKGFEIIDIERGHELALQASRFAGRTLFLGIDGSNPAMWPHLHLESQPFHAVDVSIAEPERASLDVAQLVDHSGTRLPVASVRLVATQASSSARSAPDEPEIDVEATIARIWGEVLELDDVGYDESLFDLGGHSLLVPRIIAGIKRDLNVDVTTVELFTYTTVAELGGYIRQKATVLAAQ